MEAPAASASAAQLSTMMSTPVARVDSARVREGRRRCPRRAAAGRPRSNVNSDDTICDAKRQQREGRGEGHNGRERGRLQ